MKKIISVLPETARHLYLLILLLLQFAPLYLMVNVSLKDNTQFAESAWKITFPLHWENYVSGWNAVGGTLFNTAFLAGSTTVLILFLSILGAFFFARSRGRLSRLLFWPFALMMTYPAAANMVPLFRLICDFGLYNTHLALILPAAATGQAFCIYVLRNTIEEIPQDLFDAAELDGGGLWIELRHVVLPQTMPVISTLGIFTILNQWNGFVMPLLFLRDPELQMVSVALLRWSEEYTRNWGAMMAGYAIASLPPLLLCCFCLELFVKGLSMSSGVYGKN